MAGPRPIWSPGRAPSSRRTQDIGWLVFLLLTTLPVLARIFLG
jgi:hypothetical protein